MSRAIYPNIPGSTYGPCLGGCHHTDCNAQMRDAMKFCRICHMRIGFGVFTYIDPNYKRNPQDPTGIMTDYVHAACFEGELNGKHK